MALSGFLAKIGITKLAIGAVVIASAATLIITNPFSKASASGSAPEIDPAYSNYIQAFTSGVISTQSKIKISFDKPIIDSFLYETEAIDGLFDFSPSINGTAFWISENTIEFRPEEPMPFGKEYLATFNLEAVVDNVKKGFEDFEFGFKTLDLNVELDILGLSFIDKNDGSTEQIIKGYLNSSDGIDSTQLVSMFSATQNNQKLAIDWKHENDQRRHEFVIRKVQRAKKKSSVLINYDIEYNNAQVEGKEAVEIPAEGVFVFLSGKVIHSPDQYVSVRFSDPIDENQNLNGLVQLGDIDFDYEVNNNELRLFPTTRQIGQLDVRINSAIKSVNNDVLEQDFTFTAVFEQIKPDVRWADEGNIISSSNGVYLAFEAVGLKEVDVEVVKVYQNNIVQFFQNNQLSGDNEMKRVGRPVLRKTVSLQNAGVANLLKWNRFNIDLNELTKKEPGAIYNVHVSFRMHQAAYACEGDTIKEIDWPENDWDDPSSYYNYGYSYYRYGYSYRERDNPCHVSYYLYHGRGIEKNVLASDIGVIAKRGKNNKVDFAITQLSTANPISGASIKVYNLQQQEIETLTTNAEGFADLTTDQVPFMAAVSSGKQMNYIRLDNSSALSMSHFNTSGAETKNGFKGFIYGERGVWRPGDSIFVTFILQDENKLLPEGHPIVFELEDPRGKTQVRQVKNGYESHMYAFRTKTEVNAPTGMWLAKVSVGDNVFTKSIPVETIKPNRLKINIDLDKESVTANDPYVRGTLNAKWLHGAKAKNMDAKIEATLVPVTTSFEGYENYDFDDDARSFETESREIYNGKLDHDGNALVSADLKPDSYAPGKVVAKLKTTVTEHSGYSSIDMFDVPYYPYNNFVGVKIPSGRYGWLQTDTTHNLDLVLVDTEGKPVSGSRNVTVELYKLNFRWWWDRSSDYLSNYVYSSYRRPVKSGSATVTNGKGKYSLNLARPTWGRHYLKITDPITGHSTGKVIYISWPWWAGSSDEMAGVSVLEFKADKEDYTVGDLAKINIPSTPNGRALVSLENGTKVINQFWVETSEGSTNFEVEITEEMAPNVYVHVSQIQAHGNANNDLPIRLYGIINLNVTDPQSVLQPEIDMPDVLRPEETFEMKVSEANGLPMTYTIAVVDEGLLDLTRYKTPQPWNHFYAKEALGVESFDIYKYVAGHTTGELSNILGIGGDLDASGGEESKLNRFEPCVKFLGPFYLKAGQTAEHNIKMPYYVGSVRTMVVARNESAYGSADFTTPVRTPLMVLGTLPRVLSPGEETMLPVSVFAMEKNIKKAEVKITPNEIFDVVGSNSQNINFKEIGEEMAYFKIKVKRKVGIGQVSISATSGKESAKDDIKLLVRAPNPPITNVSPYVFTSRQNKAIDLIALGIDGTNQGALEISSIPPINLQKSLYYLIGYPHGCVEQTTSKSFAQMLIPDVVDVTDNDKRRIESNVKAGVAKLLRMQVSDGGFAYWEGQLTSSEWGSNYAGHFLVEAQKRGYNVPRSALDKWRKFQTKLSNEYSDSRTVYNGYNGGLNQAYRLYTLSLFGKPNIGAMNRLRLNEKLSITATWRLAAAYIKAGQTDIANKMVADLPRRVTEYVELSNTYGSDLRDMAMILETLIDKGDQVNAALVLKNLSDRMNSRRWWGTHTTAYCVLAVSKYATNNKADKGIDFDYKIGTGETRNAKTLMSIARIKLSEDDLESGTLSITNNGKGTYYVQVVSTGQPMESDSITTANNLTLNVNYTNMQGSPIDISSLSMGTSFKAVVSITNPGLRGNYEEMALTQMIPSGWEIVNTRFEGTESTLNSSNYEYQDIRDDRILTYFDIPRSRNYKYEFILTASYAGKYYLPSVTCSAMYDNTISASVPGKWVIVTSEQFN
ncbi:MAG: hypothetical protein JXQ87_07550 [Bacteroidia bacterium]